MSAVRNAIAKQTVKFIMNHFFKRFAPSEPFQPFDLHEATLG